MTQIKTIKLPIQHAEDFDAEVNKALREGWSLTKREVIGPLATLDKSPNVYIMLYAEMERHVKGEPIKRELES